MTGRGEFSFYVFIMFCIALLSSFLCHLVRFLHPFIEFYLYPRMTVVLGNNTRLIPPRSFKVTSDSDIVSMLIREELGLVVRAVLFKWSVPTCEGFTTLESPRFIDPVTAKAILPSTSQGFISGLK